MIHKALITSILLWIYFFANAQNKSGLIIYTIKYPNENSKAKTVESRLFFNDSLSIGTSYSTKYFKQENVGLEQNKQGLAVAFKYGDEKGEIIYRNFNSEKIILRFPKSAALDEYTVEDTWTKIDWKIKDEMETIGKFKCKKAIGDFRGRTYIVWFTEEIPLPYGPYKLHGLPGLILQAEDTEQMFSVQLKGIEYPTYQEFEIHEPIEKEKKTLIEHVYSQDHIEDFLLERLNSKVPKGMRFTKDPNKKDTKRTFRVEKIFEWEQ
ncbi:MAG: GLPGLI family protein [Sediminibacterium sp.]